MPRDHLAKRARDATHARANARDAEVKTLMP